MREGAFTQRNPDSREPLTRWNVAFVQTWAAEGRTKGKLQLHAYS
jgi:hypothetical protein